MKKLVYSLALLLLASAALNVAAQNVGSLKSVVTAGFSFSMDLLPGYTDQDVVELQRVLNADSDTTVALDGDGSRGRETKFFGEKTKQAVIKFQEKYRDTILVPAGLTSGNGNVGKQTRTRLNLLIGVIDTKESVGSPESRGSSAPVATVTTTTPVITTTQTTSSTICSFVNMLVNIGAISQANSPRALSIFGCSSSTGSSSAFVDIKVNGSDERVTISSAKNVNISWTSNGVTSCQSSAGTRPVSGSVSQYISRSGTVSISCTGPNGSVYDSVSVRVRSEDDDDNNDDNGDLYVSCYASPSYISTNSQILWVANAQGGDGDYDYSWSGTDSLSGSNQSSAKTYSIAGTKSATVTVESDGESETAVCTANVSAPTDYSYLLNNNASTTATSSAEAYLNVNGTANAFVSSYSAYNLAYSTAGLNCSASSVPTISNWSGSVPLVSGLVSLNAQEIELAQSSGGKTTIHSPDGTLLETGKKTEPYWVRFSKKGGDYPNGSYVNIEGKVKCVIANTSQKTTTCVPLTETKHTFKMTCNLPAASSASSTTLATVSTFYTSTTTNPNLSAIKWPVTKTAVANVSVQSTGYPFGKFLWKPVSEADGKLVVMYGNFPDPVPVATSTGPITYMEIGGKVTGKAKCVNKNGSGSQYTGITISKCGSSPTVGRTYTVSATGEPTSTSGGIAGGGTSSSDLLVLWRPGVGPEPQVGDTILGKSENPKAEVLDFCWTGENEQGNFKSGSEGGAQNAGWLSAGGYDVDNSSGSCSGSGSGSGFFSNSSGGSSSGLFDSVLNAVTDIVQPSSQATDAIGDLF